MSISWEFKMNESESENEKIEIAKFLLTYLTDLQNPKTYL
jgi:hypothetical protein